MGYDEIIVNLPISATRKGFSVYHYPIAFYYRECDNQTKSSTNILKTILYLYIMNFQYFYNHTSPTEVYPDFHLEGPLRPLGFNEIIRYNRKLFYISHQQGFHRFPLSHRVSLVECDNQTKRLFPEAAFFQGRRKTPGIRY